MTAYAIIPYVNELMPQDTRSCVPPVCENDRSRCAQVLDTRHIRDVAVCWVRNSLPSRDGAHSVRRRRDPLRGCRGGVPLVMLPPGGFDGSFWHMAGYIGGLQDLVTCVPVDPRGLGGSTRPADSSGFVVGAIAGDVLAIADHHGFARFAVWGASLGGAVGMLLGAEHLDRVAALVLSGMCPLFEYSELRKTWRQLARLARDAGVTQGF